MNDKIKSFDNIRTWLEIDLDFEIRRLTENKLSKVLALYGTNFDRAETEASKILMRSNKLGGIISKYIDEIMKNTKDSLITIDFWKNKNGRK